MLQIYNKKESQCPLLTGIITHQVVFELLMTSLTYLLVMQVRQYYIKLTNMIFIHLKNLVVKYIGK